MVFVMTLAKDDLPELKTFFYEWLAEAEAGRRPSAFELSLQERYVWIDLCCGLSVPPLPAAA